MGGALDSEDVLIHTYVDVVKDNISMKSLSFFLFTKIHLIRQSKWVGHNWQQFVLFSNFVNFFLLNSSESFVGVIGNTV